MKINELEESASLQIARSGGMMAGHNAGGNGYRHLSYYLGGLVHLLPPCKDGTARDGSTDEDGRAQQKGRGQGCFDDMWPTHLAGGAIIDLTPVSLKGSKGKGYGNRDLTQYIDLPPAMAADGLPLWVVLLRGTVEDMEMRRIDACRVINAVEAGDLPADTIKVRNDVRNWTSRKESSKAHTSVYDADLVIEDKHGNVAQVGGWRNSTTYLRYRIEWSKVNKYAPGLFLDPDWRAFEVLPLPLHWTDNQ